jgi:hypothetical protein
MATRNDCLQCTWMTSFSSVHISYVLHFVCFRGNIKLHALLGHPVSENFVSWCQTLKNSSASFLCIQETYRRIDHLHDLAIWKWFKIVHIWHFIWFEMHLCMNRNIVWCLDNWFRILSGNLSLLTHFPWQG